MADLYTEADLETAAGFRYSAVPGEFDTLSAVDPDAAARVREATRRILDAVAPAIAARAKAAILREMAFAVSGSDVIPLSRSNVRSWLRDRADQIEAQ